MHGGGGGHHKCQPTAQTTTGTLWLWFLGHQVPGPPLSPPATPQKQTVKQAATAAAALAKIKGARRRQGYTLPEAHSKKQKIRRKTAQQGLYGKQKKNK